MNAVVAKAKNIKLVIFDVDGVLSDGSIYWDDKGIEMKAFHAHDGMGMKLLMACGIDVAIITSRESPIVTKRMRELGVQYVYQGHKNKVSAYNELLATLNVTHDQVAYLGDDIPDLALIERVGLGVAVADAVPLVRERAFYVTSNPGGRGAARELCDLILIAQDKLLPILENYR